MQRCYRAVENIFAWFSMKAQMKKYENLNLNVTQ